MDMKLGRINKDLAGKEVLPEKLWLVFFQRSISILSDSVPFLKERHIFPKAILFLNPNHNLITNQDVVLEFYYESPWKNNMLTSDEVKQGKFSSKIKQDK